MKRVLIIEDEAVVLLDLEATLEDLGYEIAGSATSLDTGMKLARELALDLAILDIDLGGSSSNQIADTLEARGVPFMFISGYTIEARPGRHASRPLITKPYSSDLLRVTLQSLSVPAIQ